MVISTFNRAEALMETLAAFAKQDIPQDSYEVIVVDDGSTDDTWAELEAIRLPTRCGPRGTKATVACRPAAIPASGWLEDGP